MLGFPGSSAALGFMQGAGLEKPQMMLNCWIECFMLKEGRVTLFVFLWEVAPARAEVPAALGATGQLAVQGTGSRGRQASCQRGVLSAALHCAQVKLSVCATGPKMLGSDAHSQKLGDLRVFACADTMQSIAGSTMHTAMVASVQMPFCGL